MNIQYSNITRLFVQYTISLSSLCKLIWRHWTYKMPLRYILSSVRLSIFSPLSIIQYVGLCLQFTHFSCDDWENIYTLSYYHHQIGSMNYYPLFRVRSWNNGVRCMCFYILIKLFNITRTEQKFVRAGDTKMWCNTHATYNVSCLINHGKWIILPRWF